MLQWLADPNQTKTQLYMEQLNYMYVFYSVASYGLQKTIRQQKHLPGP